MGMEDERVVEISRVPFWYQQLQVLKKDLARGLLTRQMATAGRTRERGRERERDCRGFFMKGVFYFP